MTQQPNERLLPCPWCQGEGFYAQDKWRGQCRRCGALGPFNYDPAKAIEHWNTRVPAAQADVVLKALYTARHFVAVNGSTGAFNDIVEEINKAIQAMSLYGETTSPAS